MSEIVNEVNQKQWVYDKAGKGTLCDSRTQAKEFMDSGEYSDHPNGEFVKPKVEKKVEKEVTVKEETPKKKIRKKKD